MCLFICFKELRLSGLLTWYFDIHNYYSDCKNETAAAYSRLTKTLKSYVTFLLQNNNYHKQKLGGGGLLLFLRTEFLLQKADKGFIELWKIIVFKL